MQIQVNTDHNVEGREALIKGVSGVVDAALGRLSHQITRVEVHLSDVSGPRTGGEDKRCMMEARLEGHPPVAVTHEAATIHQAVDGASARLGRRIESTLATLRSRQERRGGDR